MWWRDRKLSSNRQPHCNEISVFVHFEVINFRLGAIENLWWFNGINQVWDILFIFMGECVSREEYWARARPKANANICNTYVYYMIRIREVGQSASILAQNEKHASEANRREDKNFISFNASFKKMIEGSTSCCVCISLFFLSFILIFFNLRPLVRYFDGCMCALCGSDDHNGCVYGMMMMDFGRAAGEYEYDSNLFTTTITFYMTFNVSFEHLFFICLIWSIFMIRAHYSAVFLARWSFGLVQCSFLEWRRVRVYISINFNIFSTDFPFFPYIARCFSDF